MPKTIRLIDNTIVQVDSFKLFMKYPLKYWKYSEVHSSLYYNKNGIYIPYIELIIDTLPTLYDYDFVNGDKYDYQAENIAYYGLTPKHKRIDILETNNGHQVGHRKINPYWKVQENYKVPRYDDNVNKIYSTIYYVMYIKPDIYFKFSEESLDLIKDKSWFCSSVGYIATHQQNTMFSLHQLIMDHHGHGKGGKSVDHINMNKLDNRIKNLRIVTQKKQNYNRGKAVQKIKLEQSNIIAKEIPSWIVYRPQTGSHCEHFILEINGIHGKGLTKNRIRKQSTKSVKVSLHQKLIEVINFRTIAIMKMPSLLNYNIDGIHFSSIDELKEHTKLLIDKFAVQGDIEINDNLYQYNQLQTDKIIGKDKTGNQKTGNQKKNITSFPEESKYTPNSLPKYSYYIPAKGNRGSKVCFKYKDPKTGKSNSFGSTGKPSVSLDRKIDEIIEKINKSKLFIC